MILFESPRDRTGLAILVAVSVAAAALFFARPAAAPPPASASEVARSAAPEGYTELRLGDVVVEPNGQYAVDLVDGARKITIYVGQSEGRAISLRSEDRHFVRPLTVDLLDATVRELGGTVERVQVDALIRGTYHGSLHLQQRGRAIRIDARPSDAIAIALGHHAPILVANHVLTLAGQPR